MQNRPAQSGRPGALAESVIFRSDFEIAPEENSLTAENLLFLYRQFSAEFGLRGSG